MDLSNVNEIINNFSAKITAAAETNIVNSMPSLLIAALLGLIICLFGLKLIKILTTLMGILIGAGIGAGAAAAFNLGGIIPLVAIIAGAAILGAMSFFLYQFGIFLLVLCYVTGLASTFLDPQKSILFFVICIVIGVIAAVIAVIYIEPVIIIVTALSGAFAVSQAVAALLGLTGNVWIGYGIAIAAAVVGMIVQFMMHSRKIGKNEKSHAKKVKAEVSRESEVERARKILDEDKEDS